MDSKGASHVALPGEAPKMALFSRGAAAHEEVWHDRLSAQGSQRVGKERCLIVASAEQARPMQRHRDDDVAAGEQFLSGPVQPRPEGGRQRCTVGMLEGEDEVAAGFIIAEDRPGALKGRRCLDAGPAEGIGPEVEIEGLPAASAAGWPQETQLLPAARAKGAMCAARRCDHLAAFQAARRQDGVQNAVEAATNRVRNDRRNMGEERHAAI